MSLTLNLFIPTSTFPLRPLIQAEDISTGFRHTQEYSHGYHTLTQPFTKCFRLCLGTATPGGKMALSPFYRENPPEKAKNLSQVRAFKWWSSGAIQTKFYSTLLFIIKNENHPDPQVPLIGWPSQ